MQEAADKIFTMLFLVGTAYVSVAAAFYLKLMKSAPLFISYDAAAETSHECEIIELRFDQVAEVETLRRAA